MGGTLKGRKVQLGVEAVQGTPVPATAVWLGPGLPEDARTLVFRDENVGYSSGVDSTYTPQLLGKFSFDPTPLTFEQGPYVFSAGIKNVVTGAADGAGTGKIYAYPMPTLAPNTNEIATYTLEGGDEQQCEEIEYCFVPDFKITGQPGQALMLSANWEGRQVTPVAWTPAIALPSAAEVINFLEGKLFIDAANGVIGATQKSCTFIGMDLAVKTGWVSNFAGNGQKYFCGLRHTGQQMEVNLNITFEHDGTATAEKAFWRAETARQIRLQWEGSALTVGTSFSKKTFRADLAGKWAIFEKIGERNGNDIINGVFRARYNSVADLFAVFTFVNALAALP